MRWGEWVQWQMIVWVLGVGPRGGSPNFAKMKGMDLTGLFYCVIVRFLEGRGEFEFVTRLSIEMHPTCCGALAGGRIFGQLYFK